MSKQREPERCWHCDEPTGRAGRADDSLYDALENGPYCPQCWNTLCESVEEDYARMKAVVEDRPKTADGMLLVPWMPIVLVVGPYPDYDGYTVLSVTQTGVGAYITTTTGFVFCVSDNMFSSTEAAEAARSDA